MSTTPKLSIKLLIDAKANTVLFAEANKGFVDFLFSFMSLPLATVVSLLSAPDMVGSLGTVYRSLETLDDSFLQPQAGRHALLKPRAAVSPANLLSLPSVGVTNPPLYMCEYCSSRSVSRDSNESCTACKRKMTRSVSFVESKVLGDGGFVKDVVTYMVMDDLEVKPMSTISTIALINKYGIREMGDLKELVVSIGANEGVKLLKASLESKTVLTDVFVGKSSTVTEIPI